MKHFILFLFGIPSIIWRGYVLTVLWGWFIAGLFGLPALGVAQAIGLCLVVSYLTVDFSSAVRDQYVSKLPDDKSFECAVAQVVTGYLYSTLALGVGYVVKLFL